MMNDPRTQRMMARQRDGLSHLRELLRLCVERLYELESAASELELALKQEGTEINFAWAEDRAGTIASQARAMIQTVSDLGGL